MPRESGQVVWTWVAEGVDGESSLQTKSKVTGSGLGPFSTVVIRPSAWAGGNPNSSWVLRTPPAP